jgi:hypothetical protein
MTIRPRHPYYPPANLKVETKVETETHGGGKLKLKFMAVNGGVGDGIISKFSYYYTLLFQ